MTFFESGSPKKMKLEKPKHKRWVKVSHIGFNQVPILNLDNIIE
jgi:hypothetical protein